MLLVNLTLNQYKKINHTLIDVVYFLSEFISGKEKQSELL